jgi:hypothetical protein
MTSSDKFCLKWNEFQNNIVRSFQDLRKDTDFSDVTLVCEEDQQLEAHRNILATSSPFFNTVLKKNKHSHPMIYMRGVKAKELAAIVDFIYLGEANVFQEDLEGFLALAEELQLEGLAGSSNDNLGKTEEAIEKPKPNALNKPRIVKHHEKPVEDYKEESWITNPTAPVKGGEMLIPVDSTMTVDLREQIDSMVEKLGDSQYKCTVCHKIMFGKKQNMKRHVETHLEGVSHPCNQCEKVARSSNSLQNHVSRNHRN